MSKTPEVDKWEWEAGNGIDDCAVVESSIASRLEVERDEARIEKQQKDLVIADLKKNLSELDGALTEARGEREELRAALVPFVALLQDHHDELPDTQPLFGINSATVYIGQLRQASALLARMKGE